MIALREMLCAVAIERPAHTALRYAFFMAERFNASLNVVHARDFVQGGKPNLYVTGEQALAQLTNEQHALERLDALVRTVPTAGTGRATTHVVDGKLVDALVSSSDRYHSDLIVLGLDARRETAVNAEEPLAQRLGDRTLCPVLTVPHAKTTAMPRLQHILCPLERRPGAMKEVTAWVVLLARRFNAIVEVLYEAVEGGGAHDELQEALRVAGVATTTSTCPRGSSLTDAALQRIADDRCDLIVMSAMSRNATRSATLTSIRRECLAPVLSVRSTAANRVFAGNPHGISSTEDGHSLEARAASSFRVAELLGPGAQDESWKMYCTWAICPST